MAFRQSIIKESCLLECSSTVTQFDLNGQLTFVEIPTLVHISNIISEAEESKIWTIAHLPFDLFSDWKIITAGSMIIVVIVVAIILRRILNWYVEVTLKESTNRRLR